MRVPDIILNSPSLSLLNKAIESSRFHHAYLFCGPEGSGKTACAVETALTLLCRGKEEKPCRLCSSCRKLLNYNHPDFRIVFPFLSEKGFADAAKDLDFKERFATEEGMTPTYKDLYYRYLSDAAKELVRHPLAQSRLSRELQDKNREITIDQVREIIDDATMPPSESPYKIILVAEADQMNENAANALLKTLEEPPSYVKFFLVSARPQRLPPTIRSRVQILKFHPLKEEALRAYLSTLSLKTPNMASLAAHFANGSITAALDFLAEENEPLLKEAVEMIVITLTGSTGEALKLADGFSNYNWPENIRRLQFFITFLRELRLGVDPDSPLSEWPDLFGRLSGLKDRITTDFYERTFDKTRTAMEALERKVQPRFVFSALLLGMKNG